MKKQKQKELKDYKFVMYVSAEDEQDAYAYINEMNSEELRENMNLEEIK